MGQKVEERKDKYYKLAKDRGYRARSAFKLLQINKKFDIFSGVSSVVDLCAAPGSWLQVAKEKLGEKKMILGVDLLGIKKIPGITTFREDITSEKCLFELQNELGEKKADVVLHDGAPNVGTSWIQDAFVQNDLVLSALKVATSLLAQDGVFVTKVFRSKDHENLLWVFKKLFTSVETTKPAATRDVSAEIFVICKGFRGGEIDPKFFDSNHVFKEIVSLKKNVSKRASGYATEGTLVYKEISVRDFIYNEGSSKLEEYNRIVFGDSVPEGVLKSKYTTQEILECCKDLKVLGDSDLKRLQQWRKSICRELGLKKVESKKEEEEIPVEERVQKALMRELRRKRKEEERKAKKIYGHNAERTEVEMPPGVFSTPFIKEESKEADEEEDLDWLEQKFEREHEQRKEKIGIRREVQKVGDLVKEAEAVLERNKNVSYALLEGEASVSESEEERELTEKELVAAARLMNKNGRKELEEASLNRYAFDKSEKLPKWFLEDVQESETWVLEKTKEAEEILDDKCEKINRRVCKKEREAIERKKRRAYKKYEKIKNQMGQILKEEASTTEEKTKKFVKLDRELKVKSKREKTKMFVGRSGVVKKGIRRPTGKVVLVDRRAKNDLRKKKAKEKRKIR